jgi:hypothetical protein
MSDDVKAQLDRIEAALRRDALVREPILTTAEAVGYAKFGSESAFTRWARTWGVTHSGNGRWPRHRIDAGLQREARSMARSRAHADRKPQPA